MNIGSRAALFIAGVLVAYVGIWAGGYFHRWLSTFGFDAGAPHVVLILLMIGLAAIFANGIRHAYLEKSLYDLQFPMWWRNIFLIDVLSFACILGTIFAPLGNTHHNDTWVHQMSIVFLALCIPLMVWSRNFAIDVGHRNQEKNNG